MKNSLLLPRLLLSLLLASFATSATLPQQSPRRAPFSLNDDPYQATFPSSSSPSTTTTTTTTTTNLRVRHDTSTARITSPRTTRDSNARENTATDDKSEGVGVGGTPLDPTNIVAEVNVERYSVYGIQTAYYETNKTLVLTVLSSPGFTSPTDLEQLQNIFQKAYNDASPCANDPTQIRSQEIQSVEVLPNEMLSHGTNNVINSQLSSTIHYNYLIRVLVSCTACVEPPFVMFFDDVRSTPEVSICAPSKADFVQAINQELFQIQLFFQQLTSMSQILQPYEFTNYIGCSTASETSSFTTATLQIVFSSMSGFTSSSASQFSQFINAATEVYNELNVLNERTCDIQTHVVTSVVSSTWYTHSTNVVIDVTDPANAPIDPSNTYRVEIIWQGSCNGCTDLTDTCIFDDCTAPDRRFLLEVETENNDEAYLCMCPLSFLSYGPPKISNYQDELEQLITDALMEENSNYFLDSINYIQVVSND